MKKKHDFFESRAGALKTIAVLTFFEWSLDCRRIRGYEFILQIKVIIQGFHRGGNYLKALDGTGTELLGGVFAPPLPRIHKA